jgi:serine/threonine protein kinase
MIGKTISHSPREIINGSYLCKKYNLIPLSHGVKILEKLGERGMGFVHKSEDCKLDRLVALKFLPHHLTTSETDQARFLQEAKAASITMRPGRKTESQSIKK